LRFLPGRKKNERRRYLAVVRPREFSARRAVRGQPFNDRVAAIALFHDPLGGRRENAETRLDWPDIDARTKRMSSFARLKEASI